MSSHVDVTLTKKVHELRRVLQDEYNFVSDADDTLLEYMFEGFLSWTVEERSDFICGVFSELSDMGHLLTTISAVATMKITEKETSEVVPASDADVKKSSQENAKQPKTVHPITTQPKRGLSKAKQIEQARTSKRIDDEGDPRENTGTSTAATAIVSNSTASPSSILLDPSADNPPGHKSSKASSDVSQRDSRNQEVQRSLDALLGGEGAQLVALDEEVLAYLAATCAELGDDDGSEFLMVYFPVLEAKPHLALKVKRLLAASGSGSGSGPRPGSGLAREESSGGSKGVAPSKGARASKANKLSQTTPINSSLTPNLPAQGLSSTSTPLPPPPRGKGVKSTYKDFMEQLKVSAEKGIAPGDGASKEEKEEEVDDERTTEDVRFLRELMPLVGDDVIRFVYIEQCARNRSEAGRLLVEAATAGDGEEGLVALQRMKEQHEQREEEARRRAEKEEARVKQMIVKTSSEGEVLPKYDKNGKAIERPAIVFVSKGPNTKTRYRDGQAVAYKGEKFIVEKNPHDDYDGGSRGKVKPKGKRGPGWV